MTLKLNGTNSEAAPAYAGDDADTGLQCGTNELKLVTGGTARATVDSNGNLGVGTTANSDSQLHVKSGANDGNPVLRLEAATNNFLNFIQTGSVYDIRVTAGDPLSFTIGSSEKARVTSNGLTFNGDTAAANALDDYEEGQHTVTTNANLTLNSAHTNWQYTKVGRLVTFSGFFVITSVSGSNAVSISTPFAAASAPTNGNSSGVGPVMALHVDTGNAGLVTFIAQGNQQLRLYQINDSGGWVRLNNSHLASNTEMYITITYVTDA